MVTVTTVTITCDACGETFAATNRKTTSAAWVDAQQFGWFEDATGDLCFKHNPAWEQRGGFWFPTRDPA